MIAKGLPEIKILLIPSAQCGNSVKALFTQLQVKLLGSEPCRKTKPVNHLCHRPIVWCALARLEKS